MEPNGVIDTDYLHLSKVLILSGEELTLWNLLKWFVIFPPRTDRLSKKVIALSLIWVRITVIMNHCYYWECHFPQMC